VEAARRQFTQEFMNRIDKVVVFRPLGAQELRKILNIELNGLQQRIFDSENTTPFVFNLTADAKDYLLREGTDMRYGARHLKRAIDRALVHQLSNLVASGQIRSGDLIKVDYDLALGCLTFVKEAEDVPAYAMIQMIDPAAGFVPAVAAAVAPETPVARARAKSKAR
jgi:ATP-dependent Clp protease ATP-binding subunit ClpA